MEKRLVKITGRKDLPGRPIVYATTQAFLELFSLSRLSDLPNLKEIQPSPTTEAMPQPETEICPMGETPSSETEG
jgi:segregation and condensation protein B